MWIKLLEHEWNEKYQYTETNLKYRGNVKYDEVICFFNRFEPIRSFRQIPNYMGASKRLKINTDNWSIIIDCTVKQLSKLEDEYLRWNVR